MKKIVKKEFHLDGETRMFYYNLKFEQVIRNELQRLRDMGEKKSKQNLLEDIQEETGVSASSMNHWIMGHNAPGDIESIKLVAKALKKDVCDILIENAQIESANDRKEYIKMNTNITEGTETKALVREIYEAMVEFIEDFRNSCGFTYNDLGEAMYVVEEAEGKYRNISTLIHKRMLDIPFDLYNKLLRFTDGYLDSFTGDFMYDMWDIGTLSDEELVETGYDLSTLNPYSRKFLGFTTYCKNKGADETDLLVRYEYVQMIADKAYDILQEILAEYLMK